jgi:ABC-type nitrate/sulfonate/bicarbonate transport system permease component
MSGLPTKALCADWIRRRILPRGWLLVVFLMAWEVAPRLGWVDALLLPPLSAVLARGQTLLLNGRLLGDLAASAQRVLLGFSLAALLAFPLGVALSLYPALERASTGLLSALRPLSPPAWIPLAILWFGIGDAPAVFIIFVGTFATLLVGTLSATQAVDAHTVKAALTLGASRWQAVWHVILPSILPDLITQTRVGLGLAWMCVIAAEMVAVRRGIGFMMIEARNLFRIADVLAGMLSISLVGMGTDGLLRLLEGRVCRWRRGLEAARLYAGQEGQP